jgi:serine phosphatase RsbU (regulator of sigma subunit)
MNKATIFFFLLLFFSAKSLAQSYSEIELYKNAKQYYKKAYSCLNSSPDSAIIFANLAIKNLPDDSVFFKLKVYRVLSECYFYLNDIDNALKFAKESEKWALLLNNKIELSKVYNNFGILYRNNNDFDKALDYYKKSIKLSIESGDTLTINKQYGNIGVLLEYQNKYKQALSYYKKAYYIEKKHKFDEDLSTSLINLGGIYIKLNQLDSAETFLLQSIKIADSLNLGIDKEYDFELLSEVYEKRSNFSKALSLYKQLDSLKYERLDEEKIESQQQFASQYQTALKEKEIIQLNSDKKIQSYTIYSLSAIILIILAFIWIITVANKKIRTINAALLQKNEEILAQNAEIQAQRDDIQEKSNVINKQYIQLENQNQQIEKQNLDLRASMRYAKKIQESALPEFSTIAQNYFEDAFLFFNPREEVSGDFYWMKEMNNNLYIAVADCTGHGIPGALLSILGISALNNIVSSNQNIGSDELLMELRQKIISDLHQDEKDSAMQSIDMSLIIYNKQNATIEYSGSYNSIFHIRNKHLTEYKADRIPVGNSRHKFISFTKHTVNLEREDIIYLFTDGFQDQLSSKTKRKFLKQKFRDLLEELSDYSLDEQKKLLELILHEWRGSITQVDDITVMGLRV